MKFDNQQTIGQRVAYLRKEQKMTQMQLSTISGLSQKQISDIEHSVYNDMWVSTLKRLAAAFDCDLIIRLRPRYRTLTGTKHNYDEPVPRLAHREVPTGQ